MNNAGIQFVSPVEEFPIEKWDAIIAINLSSAFHTVRAAVPGMKKRNWGRIINICSAHSLVASPFKGAYVAAKHGLAGFTKVVALELARASASRSTPSRPGSCGRRWRRSSFRIWPSRRASRIEEAKKEMVSDQPIGRFVTVEEIGALALFLASDAAASITGANYSVDGGWTAK